jgi:hypothetical protein
MQRLSAIFILTLSLIASVGCSMCCGPDDFNYPTYGGIHQRADPARGRVGSILSDPFASVAGLTADSNLEPYPEPRGNSDTGAFDIDDEDFNDDLEREDEDLDDDLENLDSDQELESIDPLDEDEQPELDGASDETTTAAKPRWRRRR